MPILHAIVLGIVQGLSEFLPISSSAHLELTRWLFGWDELTPELETAFDVAVHLGTLTGAIAYLWRDVVKYTSAGIGPLLRRQPLSTDGRIAWALVASAVPAGVIGLVFKDQISNSDSIALIAVMLILFGIVLLVVDRMDERLSAEDFNVRHALAMGVGQAMALQPGVSRSGATISVARALGYSRDAAARLAFLMSLPVIAGAGVVQLADTSIPSTFWPPFIWGVAASALTGWVAVWGTLRIVRNFSFRPFVAYRVMAGLAVLGILATSWR